MRSSPARQPRRSHPRSRAARSSKQIPDAPARIPYGSDVPLLSPQLWKGSEWEAVSADLETLEDRRKRDLATGLAQVTANMLCRETATGTSAG